MSFSHWKVSTSLFSPLSSSTQGCSGFHEHTRGRPAGVDTASPGQLHGHMQGLCAWKLSTSGCPLLWKTAALSSPRKLKGELRNLKSDLLLSKCLIICSWALFYLLYWQTPVSTLTAGYLLSPAVRPFTLPSS